MKFVILEDELPAYENLRLTLLRLLPQAWVYPQLFSVEETVSFFNKELPVDLIFADIHLRDGTSFDVFNLLHIKVPVVFVTAHNNFLEHAFKHNGIAYLLKPIDEFALKSTLDKYDELKSFFSNNNTLVHSFAKTNGLQRVIVRKGNDFQLLPVDDIVYFFSDNKLVFAVEKDGKKYLCDDNNLTSIMDKLDDEIFFRANRKYIINIQYLCRFYSDERSRIIVKMQINPLDDIMVSQENGSTFKKWIGKE